ncbi:MAG: serine/threonine-protein phosphatase [Deltaproteobacteria bacterium]|nr:serine/threonine-protein phosphatase [Deltaproteobacteria bacterium]
MRCYSVEPDPFPPSLAPSAPRLRIVAAARTDVGQERSDNEDRVILADASSGRVWPPPSTVELDALPGAFFALVCDGMGGEAGGEIASSLAVEAAAAAMCAAYGKLAAPTEPLLAAALVASLEAASARIKQVARAEPVYGRMGTTATLALVTERALLCAQVGDSRAYVSSGGGLLQVTRDQTMVELLRSSGAIPDEQIANVCGPNVILQALGSSTKLEVVVSSTPIDDGDVVVLCSDGLHGPVSDDRIATLLAANEEPGAACDALVREANARGGPDNISVVVFRVGVRA